MTRLGLARGGGLGRLVLGLPTGFLACLLILAFTSSSASAADRVYWANDGSEKANRISFANLDGSGGGNLDTRGAPGGHPRGVAIDVAAGRVYWTQPGTNPSDGLISFASLDGTGGGGTLNTSGATVNHPNAAAVYPAAGRIYWANEFGNTISFANLNNTGSGNLITTDIPVGPMVDPGSRRVYWGAANPVNRISFVNLDGSGAGSVNTAGATINNPKGVAIDPVAGRIYWANIGTIASPVHVISYANLDGSGGGDLNTTGATVNTPAGVAIDPEARRIYWGNQTGNKVSFANLDGSGGGDLSAPGATVSGPRSPVLLKAPSGAGAPTITGRSRPGSVLTCSQGSWAPDMLSSWLYRTPQTLTYSWALNGKPIQGANRSTYKASAGGRYRCTVTASNPAGSSSQTSAATLAFGAKTLVTMSVAPRRIPGRGPIKVVIRNRNDFRVSGKLSARATKRGSVKRGFAVGAKARLKVRLKPSKSLKRLLKRDKKLSLRLSAKVKDPAGNTRTVRKKVSLRLKKTG